jgi:hypothetical protein
VGGEFAVAGGRADCEPAAVGVEQNPGLVGPEGTAPDAGDAADGVLGVGHVGGLRGGLVPLVEDAPEQTDGEVLRGGQDVGPVGVELFERVVLYTCDVLLLGHDGSFGLGWGGLTGRTWPAGLPPSPVLV